MYEFPTDQVPQPELTQEEPTFFSVKDKVHNMLKKGQEYIGKKEKPQMINIIYDLQSKVPKLRALN